MSSKIHRFIVDNRDRDYTNALLAEPREHIIACGGHFFLGESYNRENIARDVHVSLMHLKKEASLFFEDDPRPLVHFSPHKDGGVRMHTFSYDYDSQTIHKAPYKGPTT